MSPPSIAQAFDTFNAARLSSITLEQIWSTSYGADYAKEAQPNAFYTQSVLNTIISALGSNGSAKSTLLDLGCGHGLTGLYLAKKTDMALIGLDISPKSIEIAKSNSPTSTFLVSDGLPIPLGENSVAAVVCLDVMLYFADKAAVLREIHRVLKPGGLVAFTSWEQKGYNERLGAEQVDDYRPLVEGAGLVVQRYESLTEAEAAQRRFYSAVSRYEAQLKKEIGETPAEMFISMASSAEKEASSRRYILCLANKT